MRLFLDKLETPTIVTPLLHILGLRGTGEKRRGKGKCHSGGTWQNSHVVPDCLALSALLELLASTERSSAYSLRAFRL